MAFDKTKLPSEGSQKSVSSLLTFGALTVSSVNAYKHGVTWVIEFNLSDATQRFIKHASNDSFEFGGTAELGTGTKVFW